MTGVIAIPLKIEFVVFKSLCGCVDIEKALAERDPARTFGDSID
jgi:hypothetical protein